MVGCDGGHSLVREQMGIPRKGTDFDQLMALAVFKEESGRILLMDVVCARSDLQQVLRMAALAVRKQWQRPMVFWLSTIHAESIALRGVERNGRLGVLYSNKDYGCEWDYDWRNKRFRAEDNTKFAVNIVVYCYAS